MSDVTRTEKWKGLPDELRLKILFPFKLHTLRLLKRLDFKTANLCRRVIRDKDWQRLKNNLSDIQEELNDSFDQLQFPLTVSILDDRFKNPEHSKSNVHSCALRGPPLIATIYKIDLICIDGGNRIKPEFEEINDERINRIVDVCIEIPGLGIVSSERGLRMLLQDIIRERGVRICPIPKNAYGRSSLSDLVSGWVDVHDAEGHHEGMSITNRDSLREMPALELLDSMIVSTEISHNEFAYHRGPYSDDGWMLSVKDLMQLKVGPFSAAHACAPAFV